jgi:uncharacterized protein
MQLKENEIKSIDLFITEQCNMKCDYCFHTQTDVVLSVKQGRLILDRMKELSPANLQITFFGGEPLLYPQTILQLAEYARTLWPPDPQGRHTSTFSISTNGTFFNEEVFKKFAELGMAIQVSCDGDKITQEEYRHGDYSLIIENIKKILKLKPDMSVRMTFTPKTVGRLAINIQYLHEQVGVAKITHHAVMEEDWTDEAVQQYQYQLSQVYHYRRYCKRQNIPLEIAFIDKPLKVLNDEIPAEKEYCQAGKSYIAILDNGDVYPCHRAASARLFKLGSIFNEIPFIRGIFLNIDKEYTGCWKNCRHSRTCHSCIITHFKVNQELTKPLAKYCKLCVVESNQALGFLPVELADRRERMLYKIGNVLVDVAKQNEEILAALKQGG